jgi:hypothetical protein
MLIPNAFDLLLGVPKKEESDEAPHEVNSRQGYKEQRSSWHAS